MRRELEDPPEEKERPATEEPVVPSFLPGPRQPRDPSPGEKRPARLETPADRVAARRRLDRLAERWW
jgi:hypothetical protein